MMAEIITGDSQRETLITRLLQEHRGREVGMEIWSEQYYRAPRIT